MDAVMPFVDGLASLLEYPNRGFTRAIADVRTSTAGLPAPAATALERFASRVGDLPLSRLQEIYTQTFDMNAGCTLDMGWHLYGDRPERGAFLADLRPRLSAAGIDKNRELPDYLPHLLKLLARLEPSEASVLRGVLRPAVDRLVAGLGAAGSPYEDLVRSAFDAASPGA